MAGAGIAVAGSGGAALAELPTAAGAAGGGGAAAGGIRQSFNIEANSIVMLTSLFSLAVLTGKRLAAACHLHGNQY